MKLSNLLILCVAFLVCVITVSAVKQDSITLNSPVNGISTYQTNYTNGFNFTYYDADPSATYGVDCKLYIDNQSNNFWIMNYGFNAYGKISVPNNATKYNMIYMNHTFTGTNSSNKPVPINNSAFYWMVRCENSTATPSAPWWAAGPRTIYQDTTAPLFNITSQSFTNGTWSTTNAIWLSVFVWDPKALGQPMTIYIKNSSNQAVNHGSTTSLTNKTVNVTATLPDGDYYMLINVTNAAGRSNVTPLGDSTVNSFRVIVDATPPAISFISPVNNFIANTSTILFKWGLVEMNVSKIYFNWNGTDNNVLLAANCTGLAPNYNCTYNQSLVSYPGLYYSIAVNDSAGNYVRTINRTLNSNQAGPTVTGFYNFSVSASTAFFNATISDSNIGTCRAYIYAANDSYVTTVTGSVIATSATAATCYGTFTGTNIVNEGAFRVLYNYTSSNGINNMSTNQTGVYKAFYTGWNLFTMTASNRTVGKVCTEIENCTQVSIFNNQLQTYTTYSTSTSINIATDVPSGTPILVYVQKASSWIGANYLPTESDGVNKYATLYNAGWNHLGLLYKANVSAVYSVLTNGTLTKNVSWAAKMDPTTGTLYTCRLSLGICAGTSMNPTNISLPLGSAVYVLTDLVTNYSINRTGIRG